MMPRIYKYTLEQTTAPQKLTPMSESDFILKPISVGLDPQGDICVWCFVATGQDRVPLEDENYCIYVELCLTGGEVALCTDFLGTVQQHEFILHAFWSAEVLEEPLASDALKSNNI